LSLKDFWHSFKEKFKRPVYTDEDWRAQHHEWYPLKNGLHYPGDGCDDRKDIKHD
jgi:hypothetical protein